MKKWYQSKTIWTGIIGILTGVATILKGDQSAGITMIVTGLGLIFLRQGQGTTIVK